MMVYGVRGKRGWYVKQLEYKRNGRHSLDPVSGLWIMKKPCNRRIIKYHGAAVGIVSIRKCIWCGEAMAP